MNLLAEKILICRLCLKTSDDVTNIWETFEGSTIASILVKHFWFEINKDDGLTELLCQRCWLQTKTFHEFYRKIEQLQKCLLESTSSVEKDIEEETIDIDAAFESDLNVIKCEETDLRSGEIDMSLHYSSDDDNISDECETIKSLEKDGQCSNNEEEDEDTVTMKERLSSSENIEMESQIRELFNMKCEICKEVEFETLSKAKKHYREVHDTEGYITCCGKKFTLRYEIVKHIRHHINPDVYQLELDCEIREWFHLRCDICDNDVEFETLSEVRKHFRKVHKVKGFIKCRKSFCGDRKFRQRYEIVRHIRYHKDPDAHSCDQCGKTFPDKKALKGHIDNHVPLDSREFKCTLCKSSFARTSTLRRHVEDKHTSKTGEKFPCDKCGKNFRSNLLLSCHIRQVHELTQDFVCEVCARQFKSKYALRSHIEYEHSTSPRPKVQCDVCGAWLKHEISLRKHRELHEEFKPINCHICQKEVRNKLFLKNHIAYVHSEKQYPCTLCDKAFKTAKILKEHIAIHTGEDLYDCPYCEKKFKSNANMYSHRKKAHLAEWTRDFSKRTVARRIQMRTLDQKKRTKSIK